MTGILLGPEPSTARLAQAVRAHRPPVAGLGIGLASRGDGTCAGDGGDYRLAGRMSPQRRAEFLLGRGALHRAMADARLPVTGAVPVLDGRPRLPPGVVGALAHSGGVAVALAGSAARFDAIGVDLELSALPARAAHLVLVAEEEREWLASAPDRQATERWLLAAFCAKEAAFKAFAQLPGGRVDRLRQVRLRPAGRAFVCWPEHDRDVAVPVTVRRVGAGTFAWTVVPRRGVA